MSAIPTCRLHGKIGKAIADALLLEPKPHELGAKFGRRGYRQPLSRVSRNLRGLSRLQADPGRLSPWLTVTRPYYRTQLCPGDGRSRMVVARRRAAVAGDRRHHRTSADIRLIQYLAALPPNDRWSRFPMGSDELPLPRSPRHGRRGAGVGAVVLGAETARSFARQTARRSRPSRCRNCAVDVGATLLAKETFLRSEHRSGDRLPDRGRHDPGDPRQRKISGDSRQMTDATRDGARWYASRHGA